MENFKIYFMKNLFYIFISSLLVMCTKKDEMLFEIEYRSPYGCSHQVIIKESGKGAIKAGVEENYDKEKIDFLQILKEEKFEINEFDLERLKGLTSISTPLVKHPVNDGFRYTLIIKNIKKIDVYGSPPETLDTISNILNKYYSFQIDYFCEEYRNPDRSDL